MYRADGRATESNPGRIAAVKPCAEPPIEEEGGPRWDRVRGKLCKRLRQRRATSDVTVGGADVADLGSDCDAMELAA